MRFNNLSNEIKYDIFATMSTDELCTTVAPVCREWRQFAYTSSLWTNVKLYARKYFSTKKQTEDQMIRILNRSSKLRELKIYFAENLSWMVNCPKKFVRRLCLTFCNISSQSASQLVSIYPNVEVFIAYGHNYANDVLAKEIVKWDYLKLIYLQSENGDCNKCLDIIADNCHNLCKFYATCFQNVNDRSLTNFINRRGSQLQHLSIGGLRNVSSNVYNLLIQCQSLESLSLCDAKTFTDLNFFTTLKLENLENLAIGGSETLFSDTFSNLCCNANVSSIVNMVLTDCTNLKRDDVNIFIKRFGQNLELLSLIPTDSLTLADCKELAEEYGFQIRCNLISNTMFRVRFIRRKLQD